MIEFAHPMNGSASNRGSDVASFLEGHLYFMTVPRPQLEALAQKAVRRTFAAGELLFLAGESSGGLWIIERGRVKVYKMTAEGREHVLHLLGPGDTFNDVAAFDGGPNAASSMAITNGAAWVLAAATLADELARNHALALGVIRGLNQRLRGLVVQIEDLALRSVTARLARFLLEQRENPALSGPAVTRALIATHLGTTPETVSRALRTLEEAGAIAFDRHRIIIRNASLLREIALL
ncbi:MAG: Crp/Fnr family transcriptional regulator [Anaerolineae bacterium]|nr:Crp/Fnr family transcriptional regulator [Anaerolineae bacterium]